MVTDSLTHAFIEPSLFSLINMIYLSAFLLSSGDISYMLHGISACQVGSCLTSLSLT